MTYTHQKRPYRATAMQWDGCNTDAVLAMFEDAVLWRDCIMVRYGNMIN